MNGWHLTNVFTTGGTQILVNSQKILPGKKIIICGNGPLNFQLANELKKGGAIVKAVVESSKRSLSCALEIIPVSDHSSMSFGNNVTILYFDNIFRTYTFKILKRCI